MLASITSPTVDISANSRVLDLRAALKATSAISMLISSFLKDPVSSFLRSDSDLAANFEVDLFSSISRSSAWLRS
jgi:hypothetical protein